MKSGSNLIYSILVLMIGAAFGLSGCSRMFDSPPNLIDPGVTANTTILQLRALSTNSGQYNLVTTDLIIKGTVVANDKSGNIYKQIFIQDSTAGISIELDANGLYSNYPVGRQIFILCKGLYVINQNSMLTLGMRSVVNGTPVVTGISSSLIDTYIRRGTLNNPVIPKVVTLAQLTNDMQSMLVQLDNYEVLQNELSFTYADTSANKATVNIDIQNCAGASSKTTLRTSGYANFAGLRVPQGNGSVTAIYTVFNTTKQLVIRDTSDMKLTGTRCNGSTGGGTGGMVSIASLRSQYSGSNVTLGNVQISGTIISDATSKNISAGNIVIQDATAGVDLYFGSSAATTNFNIGDSVTIDLTGGILQSFSGLIEVNVATSQLPSAKIATGKMVTPLVLTTAQFNAQIATIECQLVKIVSAIASPAGTYVGSKILTDAAGTAVLFTSPNAIFGTQTIPTASSDWVGYGTRFNTTNQFNMRNASDVTVSASSGSGGTGTGITLATSPLMLDFNSIEAAGLPTGVFIKLGATSTTLGTDGIFTATKGLWSATGAGFKNFATHTATVTPADQAAQDAITNRALGVRQTSSTGYDPGVAFVFQLANTTGKTNLAMSFFLQSLDNTATGRTSTWTVDYGIGDNPTIFTTVTTSPATLTTTYGTFATTPVTLNFGTALNNNSSKIWIRIATLAPTSGASNRASTGIDDVKFVWQ